MVVVRLWHVRDLANCFRPAGVVILLVRSLLCLVDFSNTPVYQERFLILVMLRAKLER